MSRSILSLPPALQAVWSATYAVLCPPLYEKGPDNLLRPEPLDQTSARASEGAWEAVRRANGGELPGEAEDEPESPTDGAAEALLLAVETMLFALADDYVAGALSRDQMDAVDELERAKKALLQAIPMAESDPALVGEPRSVR